MSRKHNPPPTPKPSSGSSSNSTASDPDKTPDQRPPQHVTALVPDPPKFMPDPETPKPETRVIVANPPLKGSGSDLKLKEIRSQESARSGQTSDEDPLGQKRILRRSGYEDSMRENDARPVLPLPFPFTVTGSKARVIEAVTTLYRETSNYKGYGAAVRSELLGIAMIQVHNAEPAPNEALVLFMGIEGPATQKSRATSVVCRIDFKKVNLPAEVKDLEELEIEEAKQAKGEPNKLSA